MAGGRSVVMRSSIRERWSPRLEITSRRNGTTSIDEGLMGIVPDSSRDIASRSSTICTSRSVCCEITPRNSSISARVSSSLRV